MQDPKWGTVSHQNKMEQKYWLLWWVFYEGFLNDATWLKENRMFPFDIFHAWYFMPIFSFLVDVPNFFFDLSRARINLLGNMSMSSWVRELEDCQRVDDHLDLPVRLQSDGTFLRFKSL